MYTVILPRRIQRQLDKFSDYKRHILTDRLKELEQNPLGGSSVRVRGYQNLWKQKTTTENIYFEANEDTQEVIIVAIVPIRPRS
mgnify:CR=1 FL=1